MTAITAPQAISSEIQIHVDSTMSGHPRNADDAHVSYATTVSLDAPAGSEVRVHAPEGGRLNGWAWANDGREGISFAKDGADLVTTADVDLTEITVKGAVFNDGNPTMRVAGDTIELGDVLPRISVDGVLQEGGPGEISVHATTGWETADAAGRPDVQSRREGVSTDQATATRDAARGAATVARFTGELAGERTTGVGRVVSEAGERVGTAAAQAAYMGLVLIGAAG